MASPLRRLGVYLELVYTFPVTVLLGAGGGYLVDRWAGTEPYGVLAGFVLGLAAAFVYLVRMLGSLKEKGGNGGDGGV
ncbi:MAG: AtpZ/AtpI family protein [Acidobacteriota bacterium]